MRFVAFASSRSCFAPTLKTFHSALQLWSSVLELELRSRCTDIANIAMPTQLTKSEQEQVGHTTRSGTGGAMGAFRAVNATRRKSDVPVVNKSTIYRFAKGKTHQRGKKETRGCKKILQKKEIGNLGKVRKRSQCVSSVFEWIRV